MNVLRENAIETDPRRAADAARRVEEIVAPHNAEVDDILRFVPDQRAVFAGRFNGRPAIFRLALEPGATLAQEWTELNRVRSYMNAGDFRVVPPLALLNEGAVLVTERISGTPLLNHLWSLEQDARAVVQGHAAGWLRDLTAPTEDLREPNRGPWRNWAARSARKQPHALLRQIEERVLHKLNRLSRSLRDEEHWRTARLHGDFHPNNLILGADGTLWGHDLGAAMRGPVYLDIARFLVHSARRDMLPSGQRRYGVDQGAFDSFCDAFGMSTVERDGWMPFFIAYEVLNRVEHFRLPMPRIRHAQRMTEALFEDLRELTAD